MIKIGITGSLASGKSTVSKILSKKKYPLFSADEEVKKLYTKSYFTKKVRKLFRLKKNKLIANGIRTGFEPKISSKSRSSTPI